MTELEKIDQLRERLGLTYREAQEALERANGDVLQALVEFEEGLKEKEDELQNQLGSWSNKIVDRIRNVMRKGNITRIKIKKDGKSVAEIPATVGALGVLGVLASSELAILAGISSVAALFNKYTLELEHQDGQVEEHSLDLVNQVDN
ncbi:MAG: hypothetical protein PWP31_853 [Clostridia bacterium]|nr:hypothetical protein [Clostridia bacterium]